jgi:hypothetical protein
MAVAQKKRGPQAAPVSSRKLFSGLLGSSSVSRSSSGISSRSGSSIDSRTGGVNGSACLGSSGIDSGAGGVSRCTSGIDSGGAGIGSSVNCLGCAIHCNVRSFGCLFSSFGRLLGGLAAAASDHQQRNWQTQPCLTDISAHVVILLYPQLSTARFRRRITRLISASQSRDTPRKSLFAETGSHPIAAIQNSLTKARRLMPNLCPRSAWQPEAC